MEQQPGPTVELSDIQRFYKNTTILITGATGFIGKLLFEKVLRSLPVKKVILFIRTKKDVPPAKRYETILESPIFDSIKRSNPEVFDKVEIIQGDASLPNLGLSEHDIQTIIQEVNVIFHAAASVRFNEELKSLTRNNVRCTKDLVELSKRIKKLKTFVYVGTLYSNSNRMEIKEEVYPSRISAENLINACESLDDQCVEAFTDTLKGDWPNNYTFSKQVTEDYIAREGVHMPICICRPPIVISTANEPLKAFVDSKFTLASLALVNGLGICRISYYQNNIIDFFPADYVINGIIAAGWNNGETFRKTREEIPVYNFSSVLENPIRQADVWTWNDHYFRDFPSLHCQFYPLFFITTCKTNYLVMRHLLHTVPAWIIDKFLEIQGKEPKFTSFVKKLHELQDGYELFVSTTFFIHVENTEKMIKKMSFHDRELFNCDIRTLNWLEYFSNYSKGIRTYLVNDPMETLEEAKKKFALLKKQFTIFTIFMAIVIYVIGKIFLFRVLPFAFGLLAYFMSSIVC